MPEQHYIRKVQTSVTNFLYCKDHYLFLKRSQSKRIDPGRCNGIGGRVEPGEDFLHAAIRETEEETGYRVDPTDIQLAGIVRLEGGYDEDWVVCFFKIRVSSQEIPRGKVSDDGELLWLHKDEVLDSGHELVDDLHYCFKDIVAGERIFFLSAKVGRDHKIYDASIGRLPITNQGKIKINV